MLKLFIILFVTISINAYAQKLTLEEKTIFDEVVYKRKKVGEYEKLSKWEKPIRYKIYGDTSKYLVKEVDSFFNLVKKTTSFDIRKAKDATEENFILVFGAKPEDFQDFTRLKNPLESPANHWQKISFPNSGIIWSSILINTKKFGNKANIKGVIKKSIIKCLGFSNNSKLLPNSVFSTKGDNFKIEDFDIHIISALYLQAIKPGMTRDDVDKILIP